MPQGKKEVRPDLMLLPKGLAVWSVCALLLLLLSSLVITAADLKASSFSAFNSAVSFFSAAAVGTSVGKTRRSSRWRIGLIGGAALSIFLLSIGFLVSARSMTVEGILSVTFANVLGCLLGAIFASRGKMTKKRKGSAFKPRTNSLHNA